jgi:hypothetical protein
MTSPNNDLRASNKKKSYTSSSILWWISQVYVPNAFSSCFLN